ncbi:MAG: hypothetical protein SCK29_11885 [Bacillota bacterium]|nr:hypothetical protein [Bacillota bacterium]MDW7684804.1 hypothetical protein [Bacillota bacterium]
MIRSYKLCMLLFIVLFSSGCTQTNDTNVLPEPSAIVKNITQVAESLESFSVEVIDVINENETYVYRIWVQGEQSRFEGTLPQFGKVTQVSDGDEGRLYLEDRNIVFIHEPGKAYTIQSEGTPSGISGDSATDWTFAKVEYPLILDLNGFDVEVKGTEEIEQQQTIILSLTNQATGIEEITWWVNIETWIPVRQQIEQVNYSRLVTYKNVKINEPLDSSLFELNLPADIYVTEDIQELF